MKEVGFREKCFVAAEIVIDLSFAWKCRKEGWRCKRYVLISIIKGDYKRRNPKKTSGNCGYFDFFACKPLSYNIR